jgi:hypothetical protein
MNVHICKMYQVYDGQGNPISRWSSRGSAMILAKQIGGSYRTVYIEVPVINGIAQTHLAY